jgi:hypothetical protein
LNCQFPFGDPRDREHFHFCGKPTCENNSNVPYCEECYNLAYDSNRTKHYNNRANINPQPKVLAVKPVKEAPQKKIKTPAIAPKRMGITIEVD